MGQVTRIDQRLRSQARRSTRKFGAWVVPLARFGYAAKGIVYGVVGVLALLSALQAGHRDTTSRGALHAIFRESETLLALVAVGLFGYALWRVVQGVLDTENRGTSIIGLSKRLATIGTGVVYAGLAVSAIRLMQGESAGAGGDQKAVGWTAWLMQQPFGPWLVAIVGLGIIGYGVAEAYRGYKAAFQKKLLLSRMSEQARTLARRSGRIGEMARGAVWLVIGGLLVIAGLRHDPSRAGGVGGALRALEAQPYGMVLLGAVALGLIAYGVFMLVLARYRRIVID